MQDRKRPIEELLLDLHLDRLPAPQREELRAELDRDDELRLKSERLGQLLRPLDYWAVSPAPANLAENVLRHIDEAREESVGAGRFQTASPKMSEPQEQAGRARGLLFSMREVLAVAACILILFSVMVPGLSSFRRHSQQVLCGSRLGSLAQATGVYQEMSAGSLPYAGFAAGASWLPNKSAALPVASNSRHIYLLLKLGITDAPDQFLCPSDPTARPMETSKLAMYKDFASAANNSFDTLNLAGESPPLRPSPTTAILSDHNPLFIGGMFNAAVDPDTANSPAHGMRGQNVLKRDGSAEWTTTPLYSPRGDNLWLAGTRRAYTGTETITSPDDAFLVPGFPQVAPVSGVQEY